MSAMNTYRAPVKDMLFCMKELAGLAAVARLPGFAVFDARRHQPRPGRLNLVANVHCVSVTSRSFSAV